jgi:uroporphyrinogen-III synthase
MKILKDAFSVPVGLKTKKAMDDYGIKSFLVPEESTFECVIKKISQKN